MHFSLSLILLTLCLKALGEIPHDMEENFVSKISQKLEEAAKRENYSGAILLAHKENILFKKAYGMANRAYTSPNDLNTKFNLASEGKLFTSLAIAQLLEKGLVSLSDPVDKYLPGWIEDEIASKATIQDLLVHTSGLGSYFEDREFRLTGSSGSYLQVEDYKPLIKRDKSRFKPGTNQLYSNNGYILLGAIIEKVSGENYFEYLKKHVFDLVGMHDTGFYEMDRVIPNLAIGFGREKENDHLVWKNNLFTNVFKGSPAGGGFSTINDMFKFAQALLENKLLSNEMSKRFLSGRAIIPNAHFYNKEIDVHGQKFSIVFSDYGPAGVWNEFGLELYSESPLCLGHNGGGMRGIDNDFAIWPDTGYILIYFSNYTGDGLYYPGPEMKSLINKL